MAKKFTRGRERNHEFKRTPRSSTEHLAVVGVCRLDFQVPFATVLRAAKNTAQTLLQRRIYSNEVYK